MRIRHNAFGYQFQSVSGEIRLPILYFTLQTSRRDGLSMLAMEHIPA